MGTTRVILADDHTLVRAGLKKLLERVEGLSIVGEAATGAELLTVVADTRPNLVLLDISMPGLTGLDLLPRLRREHPTIAVLMLSAHANEEYMHRAMDRGAAGYITKDSSVAELETAIRTILAGNRHFGPRIQPRPAASVPAGARENEAQLDSLTGRQREILQLISESRSTKEIAFQLALSTKTVEAHRAQIMDRLNIRDVAGLVRFAIRVGLVTTDPR
jgi:DNA-binding NarL/FixJ family response regulator